MEIELLTNRGNAVVAWEIQLGSREGRFIESADGSISYLHAADGRSWPAGQDLAQFHRAVDAWNGYSRSVVGQPEEQQIRLVGKLREALSVAGVLQSSGSFWQVVLAQAEDGLL